MATNNAINAPLPLAVTQGGTGTNTLTNHGLLVGANAGIITQLAAANNGQLPIGSTGADPVLATITTGPNISIINAPGSITINNTGGGGGGGTNIEFFAYVSANHANFMGDGNEYTIVCDTVLFSTGGGYNNATGIFTAPQAGTYFFSAFVYMNNLNSGHVSYISSFRRGVGPRSYIGPIMNPFAARTSTGFFGMEFNRIIKLSLNDSIRLAVALGTVSSTKTITLLGNSGLQVATRFSGKLLNPS